MHRLMNVVIFAIALVLAAEAGPAAMAQGMSGKQVAGVQARHRADRPSPLGKKSNRR